MCDFQRVFLWKKCLCVCLYISESIVIIKTKKSLPLFSLHDNCAITKTQPKIPFTSMLEIAYVCYSQIVNRCGLERERKKRIYYEILNLFPSFLNISAYLAACAHCYLFEVSSMHKAAYTHTQLNSTHCTHLKNKHWIEMAKNRNSATTLTHLEHKHRQYESNC